MSESVILCEGFHDRAFWDGWLTHLGCSGDGFKPGTPGYPAQDPWNLPVGHGQYAYRSARQRFVRVRPCKGRSHVLDQARIRLAQRGTKQLLRLVINVDADISAAVTAQPLTGLRQQDVLREVQRADPTAQLDADGAIVLDGGAMKVSLLRWEAADPPAAGLPDQQSLERLVCAAIAAAYPARATAVQDWLNGRPVPPGADPKDHSWSYMAGWYAQYGCEAFYSNLWHDPRLVAELESRLQASGAWQVATLLAQ